MMTTSSLVVCTEYLSPKPTSLYAKLCEQDKLYAEMPEWQRIHSLKHSTVITGQPGTGERFWYFCRAEQMGRHSRKDCWPLLHSSVATSGEEANYLLQQ